MIQRKNEAKWIESRQRWQINVTNGDGQRKTFVSSKAGKKGKLEAERNADLWLEGENLSNNTRIEALFPQYIQYLRDKGTSKGHYRVYSSIGDNWILPHLGRYKLCKITDHRVEVMLIAARDNGLSEKYIKNINSCFSNFMKYCRKRSLTTYRPEDIEIPTGAKKSQKSALQPAEINVLFRSNQTAHAGLVSEDFFIHAYRFEVLTGLRPGELIGLQRSDISDSLMHISRSINDDSEITEGKNKNAQRSQILSQRAKEELSEQLSMLKRAGIISCYVFPDRDGNYITQENYRAAWYRYCEHNAIGFRGTHPSGNTKYITPYELRHTAHSINKQMPEALKKLIFGHSKNFDGDSVYDHVLVGDLETAAKYINSTFDSILK